MAIYYGSTATGNLYRGTDQLGVMYYGSTEINPGTIDSPIVLSGLRSYYDAANELSNPGSGSKWYGLNNTFTQNNISASFEKRNTTPPIEFDDLGGSIGGVVYNPVSGSGNVYNNIGWQSTLYPSTQNYTVLAAFKMEAVSDVGGGESGNVYFFNPQNSSLGNFSQLNINASGAWSIMVNGNSPFTIPYIPGIVASGTGLSLNQWHITQVSVSPTTVTWNFNNSITGSYTGSFQNPVIFGGAASMVGTITNVTAGLSWQGYAQVFAFYSSSLNQTQMASNFNGLRDRYGI